MSKTTSQRPSDLVGISDRWVALQLDETVTLIGLAIENAAHELHDVGTEDKPRMEPKYTMAQLLDPAFRLPRDEQTPVDACLLRGVEGVILDEVG